MRSCSQLSCWIGKRDLLNFAGRQPTWHLRLFMNLVGESRSKLFDVPQHWQKRVAKLPRLIGKRLRRVVSAD